MQTLCVSYRVCTDPLLDKYRWRMSQPKGQNKSENNDTLIVCVLVKYERLQRARYDKQIISVIGVLEIMDLGMSTRQYTVSEIKHERLGSHSKCLLAPNF